ncbi:hypothetical protein ON010_g12360 [Phytophthora cinnamomi]|nr:hypothetical protein ON010_g12360 [Phytophthora cinnamomi]
MSAHVGGHFGSGAAVAAVLGERLDVQQTLVALVRDRAGGVRNRLEDAQLHVSRVRGLDRPLNVEVLAGLESRDLAALLVHRTAASVEQVKRRRRREILLLVLREALNGGDLELVDADVDQRT